jgi:hypothetical protein
LTYSDEQRISGQFAELTHAHFLMDIGNAAVSSSRAIDDVPWMDIYG